MKISAVRLAHAFDLPGGDHELAGQFPGARGGGAAEPPDDRGARRRAQGDLRPRPGCCATGYVHLGERHGLGMVLDEERLAAAEAAAREAAAGEGGL